MRVAVASPMAVSAVCLSDISWVISASSVVVAIATRYSWACRDWVETERVCVEMERAWVEMLRDGTAAMFGRTEDANTLKL
jgi:hypothetical protein